MAESPESSLLSFLLTILRSQVREKPPGESASDPTNKFGGSTSFPEGGRFGRASANHLPRPANLW